MNVFEAVKQNLTTRQAAEMYGILLKNKATDALRYTNRLIQRLYYDV